MIHYDIFSATARGASHVDAGTVCEDSSAHFDGGTYQIAAVADGHGDRTCFRSQIGSKFAVEVVVEQLKLFAAQFPADKIDALLHSDRFREEITHQLALSVIGTWHERILAHYKANPPTEEELTSSGRYEARYRSGTDLAHIYGTTLIACLVTEQYLLTLHQGDGRIIVIRKNGRIDQPVPWDPRCRMNITTSMCNDDAVESCRFYVSDQQADPVAAVYVLTDGVEDSFRSLDSLNTFCGDLTGRCVEHGIPDAKTLEAELAGLSRRGSSDDASIAAILDLQAARPLCASFRLRMEMETGSRAMGLANLYLDSMYMKRASLASKLEDARREYAALEHEVTGLGHRMRGLAKQIRECWKESMEKAPAEKAAKAALEAAQAAYDETDAEYQEYAAKVRAGQVRCRNAENKLREMGLLDPQQPSEEAGVDGA